MSNKIANFTFDKTWLQVQNITWRETRIVQSLVHVLNVIPISASILQTRLTEQHVDLESARKIRKARIRWIEKEQFEARTQMKMCMIISLTAPGGLNTASCQCDASVDASGKCDVSGRSQHEADRCTMSICKRHWIRREKLPNAGNTRHLRQITACNRSLTMRHQKKDCETSNRSRHEAVRCKMRHLTK